jgi:hypothetical protein
LIFDGAGVKWAVALLDQQHKLHGLYREVADTVSGVCSFCAGAFGVRDAAIECRLKLLGEYDGHPGFRKLLVDGSGDYLLILAPLPANRANAGKEDAMKVFA